MQIIDQGLIQRIDQVRETVELGNADVRKVIEDVEKINQVLLHDKGEDVSTLALDLDTCISDLITVLFDAAYRVGLSEGMQLQQEIYGLIRGGHK